MFSQAVWLLTRLNALGKRLETEERCLEILTANTAIRLAGSRSEIWATVKIYTAC
jgi:hypothetical protein